MSGPMALATAQHGLKVSDHGHMYLSGFAMVFDQNIQVTGEYARFTSENCGGRSSTLAKHYLLS